jgi:hypothetical protein
VLVSAPVTLPRAPVPLADWFVALSWPALVLSLALVRGVDRLRLALVPAGLRFADEPFARLLPDPAARLALGFDALADRLLGLAELLLLRVDWAMGSSWFNLGGRGARPAAGAARRCGW